MSSPDMMLARLHTVCLACVCMVYTFEYASMHVCATHTHTHSHTHIEGGREGGERERERERERETRQDKTNSLFPRVVNKHTSAFLHSALAQRGTNLLRIHIANTK